MTFPHCHQLYQDLIKYRLCAIVVLTYPKAGSVGVQKLPGDPRGDRGLNMTRQGEYSNTIDDLDWGEARPALAEDKKGK